MLQRLYITNFRCLENFEWNLKDMPSALLIGKNGTGKSTIAAGLEILQHIGRGINRLGQLVQPKDFSRNKSDVPMRFEINVQLAESVYHYVLTLELPDNVKEVRILEEQLQVDGKPIYSRQEAQVALPEKNEAQFLIDRHLVALPVIQVRSETDPLHIFKTWLAHAIILAPIPSLITGQSNGETLEPKRDGSNLGEWLSGLLGRYPAAYTTITEYLRQAMDDLEEFRNDPTGKDTKSMNVHFAFNSASLIVNFNDLSDGEKCFFLCAAVLAANKAYGPLLCFWDEPDNYLSLSEVGHFVMGLRRAFEKNGGQLIVTSHNEEAIRRFSRENTWVIDRKNHLEPTLMRLLNELPLDGSLTEALIRGDIAL